MPLSYRNQSIDLLSKSMDWFKYDNGLHHERVKLCHNISKMFEIFMYLNQWNKKHNTVGPRSNIKVKIVMFVEPWK